MFVALKAKKLFPFIIVLLTILSLLFYPSYSAEGIKQGMEYSEVLLVPSLFPFMVISSFAMRSGASEQIGRILSVITEKIFRLPSVCSSAIILSMVGGYPIGAKCTSMLYSDGKISKKQAERMMLFCICSGPAFLITAIGTLILHNSICGIILYVSQILSCIIIGIVTGIFLGKKRTINDTSSKSQIIKPVKEDITSSFIKACSDGADSIIDMTALVMIFSMLINTAKGIGLIEILSTALSSFGISKNTSEAVISAFLEVTAGSKKIAEGGFPLWVLSFVVGFGGLCVHLQILNILKDIAFSKKKFILFRFINAVLSALITYLICLFYNPASDVFTVLGGQESQISSGTIAGTTAIVIMSVVFVLTMKTNLVFSNKNLKNKYNI